MLEQSEVRTESQLEQQRAETNLERVRARDAEDRHAVAVLAARSEAAIAADSIQQQAALERSRAAEMTLQMTHAQEAVSVAHRAHADLQVQVISTRNHHTFDCKNDEFVTKHDEPTKHKYY